jgi:AcrR family transcriptional regulator
MNRTATPQTARQQPGQDRSDPGGCARAAGRARVAGLSIYSVAERAQIPPSSVYHFFASVPALLEALTADVHRAFREALSAPIDSARSAPGMNCHG